MIYLFKFWKSKQSNNYFNTVYIFLFFHDSIWGKSLFAGTPTSYLLATIGQPEKQHKGSANRKRELMWTAAQGVPANNVYHILL